MPRLNTAHRLLLRQVCILAARMDTGQDLSAMLSKIGATPTDDSNVSHPQDKHDRDEPFFTEPTTTAQKG